MSFSKWYGRPSPGLQNINATLRIARSREGVVDFDYRPCARRCSRARGAPTRDSASRSTKIAIDGIFHLTRRHTQSLGTSMELGLFMIIFVQAQTRTPIPGARSLPQKQSASQIRRATLHQRISNRLNYATNSISRFDVSPHLLTPTLVT